jgi:hypothetical protein
MVLQRLVRRVGLLVALVGTVTAGCILAGSWMAELASSVGLDFWNVPGMLRDFHRSEQGVEHARQVQRDLHEVGEVREAILSDVLSARSTVAEGLVRFHTMRDDFPILAWNIGFLFGDMPREQALRTYYRQHLQDALERKPSATAELRMQVEALFPRQDGT